MGVRIFLWRRDCVFFLSSCSAQGRLLLSLFLVLFLCLFLRFSAAFPAAGSPYGVPQPFWLQLPALLLRWSFVVGFAVFGATLGFLPCAVLFLWGLRFAQLTLQQVTLGGFLPFLSPCDDLLLCWWRRLGGNPSLVLSVLLLHRLACRGSLGSAPCVRELPLGL